MTRAPIGTPIAGAIPTYPRGGFILVPIGAIPSPPWHGRGPNTPSSSPSCSPAIPSTSTRSTAPTDTTRSTCITHSKPWLCPTSPLVPHAPHPANATPADATPATLDATRACAELATNEPGEQQHEPNSQSLPARPRPDG
jgi:hypothetical protein